MVIRPAQEAGIRFYPKEEIFKHMLEKEDQKLKAEIDAIMNNVETIMGRVESVIPTREEKKEQKEDSN